MQNGLTQSFIEDLVKVGAVLSGIGFQPVKNNILSPVLKSLKPDGGTAMRDAVMQGSVLMLKLYEFISSTHLAQTFHYVMIVLTDGADTSSKNSLQQTIAKLYIVGQTIPVKMLKIVFIGVGVDNKTQKQLALMAAAGGKNSQYYNISSSDISNVFQKITINLGLQKRQQLLAMRNTQGDTFLHYNQQINPYLQLTQNHFACLFNLDFSGSMYGTNWNKLCAGTDYFLANLGETDFIGGMVFNNQARLIPLNLPFNQCVRKVQYPVTTVNTYQAPKPTYQAQNTYSNNTSSYQTNNNNNNNYNRLQQQQPMFSRKCIKATSIGVVVFICILLLILVIKA